MPHVHFMTGETMTAQTIKLAGRKFVIVAEKDYRDLKAKAANGRNGRSKTKTRRPTAQDRGDIAEAKRREHEPSVSLESVRKRLGL
jgi:hypothetical protein